MSTQKPQPLIWDARSLTFEFDYAEVAAMVGKTEAACRKIVQRARERVRAGGANGRPRFAVRREAHLELLGRFIEAARAQDPQQVLALLTEDATYAGDGGGKAKTTVRTVAGAQRVARPIRSPRSTCATAASPRSMWCAIPTSWACFRAPSRSARMVTYGP